MICAAGVLGGLLALTGSAGEKSKPLPGTADVKKIAVPADDNGGECGSFGTSVTFVKTPSQAAQQALQEQKLVFVLHVSGNFETPDFT